MINSWFTKHWIFADLYQYDLIEWLPMAFTLVTYQLLCDLDSVSRSTLMVFQLGCLRTMRLPTTCPSSPPPWIPEWCHPKGRTTSRTMADRPQAWCLRAISCLSSNQHSSILASNLGKHTATMNVEVASHMLYRVTFLW